ncbi:galactose-1-phosphate uridylyltransferase [Tsukamurella pulmonis]|uniref:Galactose-1-phosphate uridylyltransferase n=1 Tax=Tsukamurella pulmonis TaxID=47312 RepID=A0A1H1GW73_9ACTN|nr:galactose-1-phosphate uridylyltransferase [Tsukamurella pulmonis]KXO88207.1 galactose-1-phosphate uridylyltransferase [Tsukamurella pulmonis]SDR17485.1 UDPglucose--hexose-1-phosphate uridylyltransferase [Tsukamurella pulmonis]SUP16468.1 Galactose-1-phosphate uridylyltransferase [Tsukamurella pulmonis]
MTRHSPTPTRGALADGREILLFDLPGAPQPVLGVDHRSLAPRPAEPVTTVRRDPQTGDRVIIAPARQDRTYKPVKSMCPLCPDPEGLSSEVPVEDYRVAVFENRFPSLAGTAAPGPGPVDALRTETAGVGRCEVVCFTSDHDGAFARLPHEHARLVLDVWAHRTAELLARPEVEEVYCFENRGEEIGVTLPHPHGQIYAFPYRTPRTESIVARAEDFREREGGDLFEAILAAEVADGTRLLIRTEHTTAFVPYAAKWPVEVHVYPNRHVRNLSELTEAEADDLAAVYLALLRAFDALYDAPLPYIASWHQYRPDAEEGYLHAELFSIRRSADKLKYLAGTESGRDAFVTDKTPEAIADGLRAVIE